MRLIGDTLFAAGINWPGGPMRMQGGEGRGSLGCERGHTNRTRRFSWGKTIGLGALLFVGLLGLYGMTQISIPGSGSPL